MEPESAPPTPGRGRPRSERARTAIVQAAGELMYEGGMKAATMEAIAARAGVSKATIYKWWPSRNAVALEGFFARVRDASEIPETDDLRQALSYEVDALIQVFRDTEGGPLMRAIIGQAVADPDVALALRERWLAPRREVVAEILTEAVRRGELRADTDTDLAADQLFAPIYHRLIFGHEPLDAGMAERIVNQLLHGIAAG
ncbi:TetR family transcriptional regulator [Jatrophihabitans sp. GAS493]|uniref:TetR/AcrR family transcriptional regulator n=1 Tax=Jatrophihabitans sp. GAS493 TaxID=1907575 RepID=UPI000BB963EF|nr:TetR/AcrR family transcriptional regulator [Jatrophihabitans sp. GAS493]SOD70876.1 TetR family transcriptional regulator [Jatrophihabitans sp. GAS493]